MEKSPVKESIAHSIVESARAYLAPDGRKHPVMNLKTAASLSLSHQVSTKEVEIAALKQGVVPCRYLRNIGTIGIDGQIKLLESTAAVAGAGGLGCTIIELLARHGLGHLIIIDNGCFTERDLNRQIMSTEKNIGRPKVTAAAMRAREINSAITVTTYRERLTKKNARTLLSGAHVVADGLDNLQSRLAVEQASRELGIPYVYGTIAGFSGQLMTIFPQDTGLSSIYGSPHALPEQGIETAVGNPSATPTMIASLQVQEVVKVITGIGIPVRNQVLLVDSIQGTVDRIELNR